MILKRLAVAAFATALVTGPLVACAGQKPTQVTPGARCARSQKGMEVINPDGREYECKGGKRPRWKLDD